MANWNKDRYQEVANRGLQDQLSPERKVRFDEAVKRGLIKLPESQDDGGFIEGVKDFFTGESRETRATEELPELGEAGLLSTADTSQVAKAAPAILTTTDSQEIANILDQFPEIGIQYDEKGNIIAANNKTGKRVVINKPGASRMDLYQTLGIASLAAPAGRVASGAGAVAKGAQAAAQSGLATTGMEAYQSAVGGQFDPENVAIDTALGGLSEFIPARFAERSLAKREQAERLTREAADAEASRFVDEASPEMSARRQEQATRDIGAQVSSGQQDMAEQVREGQERITGELASQSRKRFRRDISGIASEVAPDEEITEASVRLGMDDVLTPGQISQNQVYREVEGAIAALPGSQVAERQRQAIQQTAQRADEFIEVFGGVTDKADLSERLRDRVIKNIDDLESQSEKLYQQINRKVPKSAKVDTSTIKRELSDEAELLGGEKNLEPLERRILNMSRQEPSYALIDRERKKVGQALNKASGPYKDAESGTLKRLYRMLTESQEGVADSYGAGETWQAAKALTAQRKKLENESIKLLGKDRAAAIMPKVGQSLKKLSQGDYKQFDQTIGMLPKDMKKEAVISAMNDVFTAGSRKEKSLSPAGFVDWYESLSRNQSAKNRIDGVIGESASKRLKDIYTVSKGLRNASSERVRTGVIQGLLEDFDKSGGFLSKLYQAGGKIGGAEAAGQAAGVPGIGTISSIADLVSGEKKQITEAADELLSSSEFKRSIYSYADKSVRAKQKQEAAQKALEKSEVYQKWLDRLPSDERRQVIRLGLITYLSGGDDAEPDKSQ